MALKLDMAKVNDRLEWDLLEEVMKSVCLDLKFVKLMKESVSFVLYLIILIGSHFGNIITPSRCFWQGDPLSLYLFIMGAEVLSKLPLIAENEGRIHGIKATRRAPGVSHLLFANDSFIFFNASIGEVREIKYIINDYFVTSG